MSDITICYLVLVGAVILFVWNRLPVEIVVFGVVLSLWATGVLTIEQAVGGFGETSVIFIACLFVVSEGLDSTGVTAWAGQQLIARAGKSRVRLMVLMMLLVALLTSLISVNGSVAALVPMVVILAVRLGRSPSQMLMPVAFAAHAGSLLALTGTPVSVIMSDAVESAGFAGFGFFEFAFVGVPLVIGTIGIVVLFGPRLLPERRAAVMSPDLSALAAVLPDQYDLGRTIVRLTVGEFSRCVGVRRQELDLSTHPEITLVGVQRVGALALDDLDVIEAGDVIAVRGDAADVTHLSEELGLILRSRIRDTGDEAEGLVGRDYGVSELVVSPRSDLIGQRAFPGMASSDGDLVVLAVQREGKPVMGEAELTAGDILLVRGEWGALEKNIADPGVLVVDEPADLRRQAVPLGPGATRALVILAVMVVLLATGAVPAVVAGLLAAMGLVVSRVVSMNQAYRAISWTTIVLVGGMTSLSLAMRETGAAAELADGLVNIVGDSGPYALIAGLFLLTATLGQLISNMATALIVIPIAISAAADTGISARPVLMAVNVAAAASFLTPVATPANLMVMGPGGYKFGDYWKLGLVQLGLFFVVATFLVPAIWSF